MGVSGAPTFRLQLDLDFNIRRHICTFHFDLEEGFNYFSEKIRGVHFLKKIYLIWLGV